MSLCAAREVYRGLVLFCTGSLLGQYQSTVKILDKQYCYLYLKKIYVLMIFFIVFLTWMVFERLPNCNDYKLNKTNSMTWRRRNETGCCCQGAAVFSFILGARSKCLVMLLTPNFHWILSAALWLWSGFGPLSGNPHRLHFESNTAQYGKQLASQGRRVSAIIT